MDDDNALYLPAGPRRPEGSGGSPTEEFVATRRTQGGWHPEHQWGGAVQALLTRAVERTPTLVPMQVTRLTHDLFRPVPIGPPLSLSVQIVREGKKIQVVDAVLRVADVEHARTRALRVRDEDMTAVAGLLHTTAALDAADQPPWAEDLEPTDIAEGASREARPGFLDGVELRRFAVPDGPEGSYGYWARQRSPLVAGEATTALQRLSVVGDLTNMIGAIFEGRRVSAINPDLNVHVVRVPEGEWIAVLGETRLGLATGTGVSAARLRDHLGVCGLATTCQLIANR